MQKIRKYSYLIFHRTWNILGSFGQNPERDFYKKIEPFHFLSQMIP